MENCLFTESLCLSNYAEWISETMLCRTKKEKKKQEKDPAPGLHSSPHPDCPCSWNTANHS